MQVKLFIHLAIIAIIAILSNTDMAQSKPLNGVNKLAFLSHGSRIRRAVGLRAAREDYEIEKDPTVTGPHLRTRRQAPPKESDIPQEFQTTVQMFRAKRQMPSPPKELPMPPM